MHTMRKAMRNAMRKAAKNADIDKQNDAHLFPFEVPLLRSGLHFMIHHNHTAPTAVFACTFRI